MVTQTGSPTLVVFDGEYDLASKTAVRSALEFLQNATPAIMDFSAVTYIDSTVLSEMARLHQARTERGLGRPTLILQNANIRRVLHIASMSEIFEIVETRDEAVRSCSGDLVVRHASSFE